MTNSELEVIISARPYICYTHAIMGYPPIMAIVVKNNTERAIRNVRFSCSSDSGTIEPISLTIEEIPAGEEVSVEPEVRLADENLIQATEPYEETIRFDITIAGKTPKKGACRIKVMTGSNDIFEAESFDINVLAFDQWTSDVPYSIAYFVTPNHPAVTPVISRASEILGKWTGMASLEGYQAQNPERVRKMAAAVFQAIREQDIAYTNPPATYKIPGQRIRSAGDVLTSHMGTCIDLAVLYASCLEAIRLNPFIVVTEDHAFAGAWLEEKTFPELIEEDLSQLVNRLGLGMNQLFVAECTCLCNDKSTSFNDACMCGRWNLLNKDEHLGCVDIARARRSGILPMPTRVMGKSGWELQTSRTRNSPEASAPITHAISTSFIDETSKDKLTKRDLWERNLLDLTLRNNLLNMRIGSRLMPLAAPSLDDLENSLADGTSLSISPKPREWGKVDPAFELVAFIGEMKGFLDGELKSKRLRTFLTEAELSKAITGLYRASNLSLEETGSNTLYMSFGALRWFRSGDSTPHYAPLVMIPVEIIRKSAKRGYALAVRDEDPQINVSLLEMLRRDFGIDIGGLDPLPLDKRGIDTRIVFNTFKHKIIGQAQWEVLEVACLGIFSFSQFVMWNDIHSHETELRRSPIVSSLLDGHLTWNAQPMVMPNKIEQEDTLLTVEADASQLFAIKEAVTDKSFVLHGPPGTGKSQVITGIIANALMHDKRVLFVSEKAAALNVVEKRLNKLGIGKVCIELHSNKANKAHVLDQLQQASEMNAGNTLGEYDTQLEAVRHLKAELDEYAEALCEKNEAGLTLREQICRYEKLRDRELPWIDIPAGYIETIDGRTDLEDDIRAVERLSAATSDTVNPANHPLRRVLGSTYTHTALFELKPALNALDDALINLETKSIGITDVLEVSMPSTREEWAQFIEMISSSLHVPLLPASWIAQTNLTPLINGIERVMNEGEQIDTLVSTNPEWIPAFFQLDADSLNIEWHQAQSAGFFKKKKAMEAVVGKVSSYSKRTISEQDIPRAVAALRDFDAKKTAHKSHLANIAPLLSDFACFDDYDREAISAAIANARESIASGALTDPATKSLCAKLATDKALPSRCAGLTACWEDVLSAFSDVESIVGGIFVASNEGWIPALRETTSSLREHSLELQEWMLWRASANLVEQRGLACVVDAIMSGTPPQEIPVAFEKSLYRAMCAASLAKHKAIAAFSGRVFEEAVRQYAEASNKLMELARKELLLHLASKVPNLTLAAQNGSEAAILKRAIRSRGRGVSIRSLFSSIPTLIKGLAPCMLMSPLSVAQYLDFSNEPFDLVIFDEASQLQTCKAVGALARAKHAIIVGDPNQMPPTAFFASQMNDDELSDIADMESILEDCLAINMPETYLQWHYRSQHESLISFSNMQFYKSKMCTFPSADDSVSRVHSVHVPGYYEGSGRNSFEARAVVEELRRRFAESSGKPQSLGVITFNVKQQALIEDLLDEEYAKDPSFESWTLAGPEPLFVKNLENVQGDERDVILFSITYAPDENGKMAMRFGPVNTEGGWRRLNVAITRARREMILFSTLEPEQIDLSKTSSKGIRALKGFLEFARRGHFVSTGTTSSSDEDYIATQVCERLEAQGYTVKRNIGSSSYKVDIAISDNALEGRYLAGVLLDGASYGRAKSTHDREVSRETILKNLGWHIFHIWSIDWWANSSKVISDLSTFLEKTKAIATAQHKDDAADTASKIPFDQTGAYKPEITILAPNQKTESTSPFKPIDKHEPDSERFFAIDSASVERKPDQEKPTVIYVDSPSSSDIEVVPYQYAMLPDGPTLSSDEYTGSNEEEITARFQKVIDTEAPIEKTRLCNKVRESFGIARSGHRIQARNNEILGKTEHKEAKRGEEVFVWRREDDPMSFKSVRIPDPDDMPASNEISDEEIACLFVLVISESGPMSRDNLIRTAATRYGYRRIASKIQGIFAEAIPKAKRRKMIVEENGLIRLPNAQKDDTC